MQSRLEKPASAVCQGRANGSGYNSSWTASLAILHPGVIYSIWRGHLQTFLGFSSIAGSRSHDSRSEFVLNSATFFTKYHATFHRFFAGDCYFWLDEETRSESHWWRTMGLKRNQIGSREENRTSTWKLCGHKHVLQLYLFAAKIRDGNIGLVFFTFANKEALILVFFQVEINDDFFDNVLKMFRHFRENIYHFINAPVDRETYTWNLISYPFTVNAFHLQQLNSIGKSIW